MLQYVKKTKKQLLVTGTPVFDHKGELTLIVINERDMTELNAVRAQFEKSRMVTQKYKDELSEIEPAGTEKTKYCFKKCTDA